MNLQGYDYDKIEETANELFDGLGFKTFPVNPFEVAKRLNINLFAYSSFCQTDRDYLIQKRNDGFSYKKNDFGYGICYNDYKKYNRILFTLWYEIAHIQLGHLDGCTKSQEQMHTECNHFASYCLSPIAFVIMSRPNCQEDIQFTFNVSFECAYYLYNKYLNVISFGVSFIKKIVSNPIVNILQYNNSIIA